MLTLARQGDEVDLPDELDEAIRIYDLVQLTGWSLEYLDNSPAMVLDRLLLVRAADIQVQKRSMKDE